MSFEQITKKYLKDFQKVCDRSWVAGVGSVEMATRPIVHTYIDEILNLFKSSSSEIVIHHDVTYTKYDRPDWRVEDKYTFGIYCFGDHKNLSLNKPFQLNAKEQKQIERYLAFGRPVFVFDGIEFLIFSPKDKLPARYSLVNKEDISKTSRWSDLTINNSIEYLLKEILDNPGFRKWTEIELIEQLAMRCRIIADEISFLLSAPVGSGMTESEENLLRALHDLSEVIVDHHDVSLKTPHSCADFIAQVLTFGLFYAHTRYSSAELAPTEKSKEIRRFWKVGYENGYAQKLRPFRAIVDSLSLSLKEENILSEWYEEILGVLAYAEYMGTDKESNDFHALFETFLAKFDAKTRFDRGAFYTPKVLADWLVLATEEVSKRTLGANIASYATNVIDPCCGTGSFLESLQKIIKGPLSSSNQLIGFELLPAPYALSHYRLSQVYSSDELKNIKILLTDTLSDSIQSIPEKHKGGFLEEKMDAASSCKLPLRLVIGNPPSSNHPIESSPRELIQEMMEEFRPPKLERTDRQNIQKALNNEAYRFLRWCAQRVIESERGILALILPGAFSQSVSFKYVRKWLMDKFGTIYILEIDEDARRGDSTQSLFSVLQGRLAMIASYEKNNMETDKAEVFYLSIGSICLNEKKEYLRAMPDLGIFEKIKPQEPSWEFSPAVAYPRELWQICIPLTGDKGNSVFKSKCSALKLAPTAALFHTNKQTLARRSLELSGNLKSLTTEQAIEKWFKGQRKPPALKKFTEEVKKALTSINVIADIKPYLFRPFTSGWVIDNEKLFAALVKTPGSGTRARPEIRKAFSDGAIGIALAPGPATLGETLTRFACFSWCLPDNDIAARGNAMIYCNKMPQPGVTTSASNIDSDFLNYFDFDVKPEDAVTFYVYAILSSNTYLDTFEGVLYKSSDPTTPPRIPLASNQDDRAVLSELGKEIAECERFGGVGVGSKLKVEWPKNFKGMMLKKISYDEEMQRLYLHSEEQSLIIFGVEPEVINLSIAGHNIIDKWIREKTYSYLRRDFTAADVDELLILISKITQQYRLIEKVDERLSSILEKRSLIDLSSKV